MRHLHPRLVYLLDPRCCRILFQEYQGRNPVESEVTSLNGIVKDAGGSIVCQVTIVNSILAYGMAADCSHRNNNP